MDKETLSNYGWIVICVLVLAVMLALSSPFGTFVATGVKSTTQGLFDTNQKALNTTGLVNIDDQDFGDIPSGGVYTKADGTILKSDNGDKFPDTPATGDTYEYGDYIYKYNCYYGPGDWRTSTTQNGWGVKVKDTGKSSYGEILSEIAGKPVNTLDNTFSSCTTLTTAPTIPNSVINMFGTFRDCTSLTTAPTIPNSVTGMTDTFSSCTTLTTAPAIPSSVISMSGTFSGCKSLTTAPTIPKSVINMSYTFNGCTNLTTAPTIPNSVTNIESAFSGCKSLTTAPTIPNSVTNMFHTFRNCTKLTTAPTIPSSVTDMCGTFYGCTALETAPTIPNGVTDMDSTFQGCTSLTGTIKINANPTYYSNCFYNTTQQITLTGTSSKLNNIASSYSNVTVASTP